MKVLKLIAIVPLVLLSANTFAQGRQQGSRNDRDSYGSRNSYNDRDRYDSGYNDRDRGRGYDSGYSDRHRTSGRRYTGSRYSYSSVAPYASYRPSGLSIGLYNDYGYGADYGYGYGSASYGYSPYGSYPASSYRSYRPATGLRLSLNIGGRNGRHNARGRHR